MHKYIGNYAYWPKQKEWKSVLQLTQQKCPVIALQVTALP